MRSWLKRCVCSLVFCGCGCSKPVPAEVDGFYQRECRFENDGKLFRLRGYLSVPSGDVWIDRSQTVGLQLGSSVGAGGETVKTSTRHFATLPPRFSNDDLHVDLRTGGRSSYDQLLDVTIELDVTETLFGDNKGKPSCVLEFVRAEAAPK